MKCKKVYKTQDGEVAKPIAVAKCNLLMYYFAGAVKILPALTDGRFTVLVNYRRHCAGLQVNSKRTILSNSVPCWHSEKQFYIVDVNKTTL
jgi:hypothetical protein